jgi:hypothetical protein
MCRRRSRETTARWRRRRVTNPAQTGPFRAALGDVPFGLRAPQYAAPFGLCAALDDVPDAVPVFPGAVACQSAESASLSPGLQRPQMLSTAQAPLPSSTRPVPERKRTFRRESISISLFSVTLDLPILIVASMDVPSHPGAIPPVLVYSGPAETSATRGRRFRNSGCQPTTGIGRCCAPAASG